MTRFFNAVQAGLSVAALALAGLPPGLVGAGTRSEETAPDKQEQGQTTDPCRGVDCNSEGAAEECCSDPKKRHGGPGGWTIEKVDPDKRKTRGGKGVWVDDWYSADDANTHKPGPEWKAGYPTPSGKWSLAVSPGVVIGGTAGSETGFVAGGEISANAVTGGHMWIAWLGGVVDSVHNVRNGCTRTSLGPAAGFGFLGIDAGVSIQSGCGDAAVGSAIRPFLTMGVAAVSYRHEFFPTQSKTVHEFGLALKMPVVFKEGKPVPWWNLM